MTSSESDDLLISDLIDLPVAEREAYLIRTCGNDFVMRQRLVGKLAQLMDSLSTPGSTSQTPARSSLVEVAHALASGLEVQEKPGTTIGRYKLVLKIGEGGCGIVYLAEQQQPVQRQVALKLIKLGLDTREFVARFEAERQALALMEHPNIARVFDAGATEVGRPYFVMELVLGVPITRFCDENNLPLCDRLRLFVSVCQAVQHAHQKGVIHRDLKPSNILVVLHDGVPVPKIIDFGIAKAMGVRLAEQTLLTQFHSFIGTPAYASPEQLEMSGLDVDTRTDVYSLGVLLYELLTGRTPFDNQALIRTGLDAMRKTIRETEPPRPSTRLSTTAETDLNEIANRRGIEPPRLLHLVRGDLDWIVMRCLEKDRNRRYETANGLAADLNRHLNDEPIVARPPSSVYRFQKLVRRNKVVFTAGAAVIITLVFGLVASTWQAVRATHAERKALTAQAAEATARTRAEAQELVARQRAYASDMNVAWQALHENNLGRAQDLLERQRPQPGQSDLRGWEWRYLWQQTRSDALSILCEKSSEIESLAVSADGRWLAIGVVHKDGLFIWDLVTRKEVAHLAQGTNRVRAVFSPTEPLLAFATAGNGLCLHFWNAATQQTVAELPLEGWANDLAFSGDGKTVVTSAGEEGKGHITLWRVHDGTPLASYPSAKSDIGPACTSFAIVPDTSVAAYASDPLVRVVDLHTGHELWNAVVAKQFIVAVAISPDGKTLATAAGYAESDIRLWEVATGKEIGRLVGHSSFVTSLVFWPDGRRLASSSGDHSIRIWDVASRTCTDVLCGHRSEVWRLVLLPDNRTLVSGCKDGVVCLWDTAITHPRREHLTWPEAIGSWCFAADNRSILTLNGEGQVARWTGPDFQAKEILVETVTGGFIKGLFSSDGRWLAWVAPDNTISVWDISRRTTSRTFKVAGSDAIPMRFLAEGKRLLIWSHGDFRLIDWDLVANKEVLSWPAIGDQFVFNWGLTPGDKLLLTTGAAGEVWVRNLAEKSTTKPHLDILEPMGLTIAPSGRLLAITSGLGYARVWDTASWQEVTTLRGFLNGVFSAAFSPDGQRLAIGAGANGEALKIWAVEGWQDVLTLSAEEGHLFINDAFSSDGNSVGVMTVSGKLHIWRAPSWEEIGKAEAKDRASTSP